MRLQLPLQGADKNVTDTDDWKTVRRIVKEGLGATSYIIFLIALVLSISNKQHYFFVPGLVRRAGGAVEGPQQL